MSRPEHWLASPATAARVRRPHRRGMKTSALAVFAVLTALPALCKAEPSLGAEQPVPLVASPADAAPREAPTSLGSTQELMVHGLEAAAAAQIWDGVHR